MTWVSRRSGKKQEHILNYGKGIEKSSKSLLVSTKGQGTVSVYKVEPKFTLVEAKRSNTTTSTFQTSVSFHIRGRKEEQWT